MTANRTVITEQDIRDSIDKTIDRNMDSVHYSDIDDDGNDIPDAQFEELQQEVEDRDRKDIIFDIVHPLVKAGDVPKVYIDLDGDRVATLRGNQVKDWETIHKNYAPRGGTVKLQVRNKAGHYKGQQTVNFGDYRNDEEETTQSKSESGVATELFKYVTEMSKSNDDKFERLLERMENTKQSENNQTMTLLTAVLSKTLETPKNDNNLEFMKMMMDMQKSSQEQTARLIEKMDEKFSRTIEKLTDGKKDDQSFSPLDVMKMIQDANKEGKDDALTMMELIDKKAELKALESSENESSKSITDRAIESLLPALPSLLAMGKGANVPTPSPQVQNPRARRSLSQPERRPTSHQTPNRPNQGAQVQRSTHAQGGEIPTREVETVVVDASHGMPSVVTPRNEQGNNEQVAQDSKPSIIDTETVNQNIDNSIDKDALRGQVVELAIPTVLQYLAQSGGSTDCAIDVKIQLEDNGIPLHLVGELLTSELVLQIAEQQGLMDLARQSGQEEAAKDWLKDFHVSLVKECSI